MKLKILKNIFIAVLVVFLVTAITIFSAMYIYYSNITSEELKASAKYISAAIDSQGTEFLEKIEDENIAGFKLIDKSGTLVCEIGNHDENFSYETAETKFGELTVYGNRDTAATLVINLFYQVVIALSVAIVVSIFIASRIAKGITAPINKIDLENPDDRGIYPELKPFVRKIASQNRKIHSQVSELKLEHERQDRLRREFTANVSHELKTPLTSIGGTAEIIRDGLVRAEDISHFADNIHKETGRLINLVEDIIKLSRLEESSSDSEEKANISLLSLAETTAERLSQAATRAQVSVEVSGDEGTILAPERIAEQIAFNLLDNAIKYNRAGGKVEARIKEEEGKVVFSVKDSGIGIPKEELSRIFERFYRVDKSRSKLVGGTGLGLSIVKHSALSLGAEIEVESEVGSGTEIRIIFPKA